MNTVLNVVQFSLLNVIEPSHRSVSNHPSSPHGLGLLLTMGLPREGHLTFASPMGTVASFGLRL